MANHRVATLLASKSNTTPGTETVDVDVRAPISRISIHNKVTSAGTVLTAHPAANISKIELIDGSNILASLSGYQCQALNFYNQKKTPNCFLTDISAVQTWQTFDLDFGRWLFDTLYALDPTRYDNLQLKITHNYQTADASASASTLEVYAHAFDKKKITPIGFLRAREHKAYTCGADGTTEYVELPIDQTIRQILVRASANDYYPWQVANRLKLSENSDAVVPMDISTSAFLKHINREYPRVEEPAAIAVNQTARDVYTMAVWQLHFGLMPVTVTNIIAMEAVNKSLPVALDITASDNCTGIISGCQPHACFPIPFGDQEDPNDWYDLAGVDKLNLQVKAGSAGTNGSVSVVLEQLQRY
ncbi:MAG: hypothetical protein PHF64_11435 [Methanoregula sp.]|nr:hypothetical protein [Methanoregula sp.]